MTTLKKPDGTITADMRETLTVTLEQLILEDNILDDTEYHKGKSTPCWTTNRHNRRQTFYTRQSGRWSKGVNPAKRQTQTELLMKYNNQFKRA